MTGKIENNKLSKQQTDEALIKISQTGIIVFDEFDKLATGDKNDHAGQFLTMLQGELLKFVEGGKGHAEHYPANEIDTTDILFVFSGAFISLLEPAKVPKNRAIGFSATPATNDEQSTEVDRTHVPTTEELTRFGFMPELLGRIPLKCRYSALSMNALCKILTESKISPVHDFNALFSETGNSLRFQQSALKAVARKALDVGTGARGLRSIIGDFLYPLLYEIDGVVDNTEIVITKGVVARGAKPALRPRKDLFLSETEIIRRLGKKNNDLKVFDPVEIE